MCSRAATCGPTSVGMLVLLFLGVWEPLTVTPLSTVWQGNSSEIRQECAGLWRADAARGLAKKAEESPQNVGAPTVGAWSNCSANRRLGPGGRGIDYAPS